jgi:hypothetical protein
MLGILKFHGLTAFRINYEKLENKSGGRIQETQTDLSLPIELSGLRAICESFRALDDQLVVAGKSELFE